MIDLSVLEAGEESTIATKEIVPTVSNSSANATTTERRRRPAISKSILFFDLETIPDYERMESFGLDPIPDATPRMEPQGCPAAEELLKGTLEEFKTTLAKLNPVDDVLDEIDRIERIAKKPRKGIFDLTADLRKQDSARDDALIARRKLMSVTPEFNRIVALGWNDGRPTKSMVVGEKNDIDFVVDESHLLEFFWSVAAKTKFVCGFNILGFDLPTIFVRSILLDIAPTRQFDMKPWGADVIDLMKKRFPSGQAVGLKKIAKAMGIVVPAGDVDGSQVEELWKADPSKVGEYVRSDVDLVKELHQRYSGFFC